MQRSDVIAAYPLACSMRALDSKRPAIEDALALCPFFKGQSKGQKRCSDIKTKVCSGWVRPITRSINHPASGRGGLVRHRLRKNGSFFRESVYPPAARFIMADSSCLATNRTTNGTMSGSGLSARPSWLWHLVLVLGFMQLQSQIVRL